MRKQRSTQLATFCASKIAKYEASNDKWTKFDEVLINQVRGYPYLYDHTSNHFRDYYLKKNTWKKIAEDLESDEKNCLKRWKNLRDTYVRNKRALRASFSDKSVINFKNLKPLNFLDAFVKHRSKDQTFEFKSEALESDEFSQMTKNIDEENSNSMTPVGDSFENDACSPDDLSGDISLNFKRPKENLKIPQDVINVLSHQNKQEYLSLNDTNLLNDNLITYGDSNNSLLKQNLLVDLELESFVKSVSATLHRFSPHQKACAKVKIQQLLLDIEFARESPISSN